MCGIAAYVGKREPISTLFQLLIELQHRGQEAYGIAVALRNGDIDAMHGGGFIQNVTPSGFRTIEKESFGGIGHVRYSTSGGYMDAVVQPIVVGDKFRIAVAFNGTIANYKELAREYGLGKAESDTNVFANALYIEALQHGRDVVEALKSLADKVIGGFSVVVLTNEPRIVFAKDPRGFRPLAYVYTGEELFVASETAALDIVAGGMWSEVEPGEVLSFDGGSLERSRATLAAEPSPCVFEYVYFSRPDSVFNGISVYTARLNMGVELARADSVEADIVVPVPDSGRAIALGYSRASGLPIEEAIYVNKYLGRGFIAPPSVRSTVARLKYGLIKHAIEGKRIVLVDDSIVRGTTMRDLIAKLRNAGAKEVHVRVGSPPFRFPCFMGIDVSTSKELLAWGSMSLDNIRSALGADSVLYNSVEALTRAVGLCKLCTACFTGIYPFRGYTASDLERMFSR